jgi:mono/diheme cytochrome c family protein
LGELNCLACHQADPAITSRLLPRKSPTLDSVRLTPQYLRSFLAAPSVETPGTTMPDLLHGLNATEKAATVDALVHFLSSAQPTNSVEGFAANQTLILQGRALYHQIGCVACHAPQENIPVLAIQPTNAAAAETSGVADMRLGTKSVPLGNLAKKMTVGDLAKFLRDPLKARPSGRMPSMNLSANEATAIAMYLLRDQLAATNTHPAIKVRGLDYQYFEGQFTETSQIEGQQKAEGTTDRFSLTPRKRTEYFGLRFSGLLAVPADGTYTFYTASDDGSRLWVDGQLVVDNDFHHATEEKTGSIHLKAGDHPILLRYFNADGGLELKVAYSGPGLAKQEIPPSVLFRMAEPMLPVGEENFAVDQGKAARGRDLFASIGCANCHQLAKGAIASTLHVRPLFDLNPNAVDNCLNDSPQRAAKYQLLGAQRQAIKSALASRPNLSQPLTPGEQVMRQMAAFNCFACHSRDGAGGPATERAEFFRVMGEADLGDEGRLPPHLTRVGAKLRPEWLREVLLNKGTARPYMATRMPQFGQENAGPLLAGFLKADAPDQSAATASKIAPSATPSNTEVGYGRKLVGTDGFSCISCHTFAGHKSLGIPAMDLSLMTGRLLKDWFRRYLLDPPSLRPGTRMPNFFPEGISARKDILDGDSSRQIDALWAYLSRGKEAGLPPGLIQGKMELVASNEALIYRNFLQGGGPRAIGVAYPEKANLVFDGNELRLALIWQGPFIDAARHRTGRGDGFEGPLGYNVAKLPPGPPFAILETQESPWPAAAGKAAGYHMNGYRLDDKRRPTFLYSAPSVHIEDYPMAVSGELEPFLRRTLTLQAEAPVPHLWFRAWAGARLEAKPDRSFLADGKITLRFQLPSDSKPLVRHRGAETELLIPVEFQGQQSKLIEEIIW